MGQHLRKVLIQNQKPPYLIILAEILQKLLKKVALIRLLGAKKKLNVSHKYYVDVKRIIQF